MFNNSDMNRCPYVSVLLYDDTGKLTTGEDTRFKLNTDGGFYDGKF